MSWSRELPLTSVLTRVLHLQLRAERLILARKIAVAEAQARSLGLPTDEFRAARRALATPVVLEKPDPLLMLEAAPEPRSTDPLQHIKVED